jgi:hypothetical protein
VSGVTMTTTRFSNILDLYIPVSYIFVVGCYERENCWDDNKYGEESFKERKLKQNKKSGLISP